MSQTDPRAVEHRAKLEQAIDNMEKTSVCLDIFDRALADAERRGMERAAKVADEYPQRDPAEDGNGYWAAWEIAQAIRTQAQSKQEAPHGTDAE